jgi:hypothetical protein
MAVSDQHSNRPGDASRVADSEAFLEQSYLTYIIPFATNFSPESALQQGAGSVETIISSIEQRDQLFFGTRFAHCSLLLRSHRSCAGRR